jgi:toxin YoeB
VRVAFTPHALADLRHWQKTDHKMAARVLDLLEEIRRDPFAGPGKPEPLRFQFTGCWSRRLTREHRLVCLVEKGEIVVLACRYHYGK